MNTYFESIIQSIHLLPAFILFLAIPILIFAYRKFGGHILWKTLMIYSFLFYLFILFMVAILPLPTNEMLALMPTPTPQLLPLQFLTHMQAEAKLETVTLLQLMKSPTFYQPIGTILLMLPLGIYMKNYFDTSFSSIFIIALFISIFLEVTQLTGIFGLYPQAYRTFDVDDILLSILGALIGGMLAYPLRLFSLKSKPVTEWEINENQIVSLPLRLLGLLIDGLLCISIAIIISLFIKEFRYLVPMSIALLFFYHIIVIYLTNGITLGKKVVHIAVVPLDDDYLTFGQVTQRYAILFIYYPLGIYIGSFLISRLFIARSNMISMIGAGIFFFALIFLPMIIIIHFFRNQNMFFYEKKSRTIHINELQPETFDASYLEETQEHDTIVEHEKNIFDDEEIDFDHFD